MPAAGRRNGARVHALRRLPPGASGALTAEPPSDLAVDRWIESPGCACLLESR
jgi:hypothetical protein